MQVSFDMPEYTADVDGLGTLRLLDAIRMCGMEKTCRFYQASTSELYGKVQEVPQKETTPFYPRSPYGRPATSCFRRACQVPNAIALASRPCVVACDCLSERSCGQAVLLLDGHQLPRGVQHARQQRNPVQPRKPSSR